MTERLPSNSRVQRTPLRGAADAPSRCTDWVLGGDFLWSLQHPLRIKEERHARSANRGL